MLDNLKVFICAAEQRSLTKASHTLGIPIATVSRRVIELEQQLGCELFHRSNKGLALTPAGQTYYRECSGFINELSVRLTNLDQALNSLSGELKVMAPTNLGNGPLDAFWQSFVSNHPSIALTVQLGDPSDDVIDNQADIALRSGPQESSSLIQKYVGYIIPILVAAPSFSNRLPKHPTDLALYSSIAAQLFSDWILINKRQREAVHKKHNHISNDMQVTLDLVKAGAGIALLPMSMVHREMREGELVQILPSWQGVQRDIYIVWPYQRSLSIRASLFRDELVNFLHKQSWFVPHSS